MKRLLRHRQTKAFFNAGQWVNDARHAQVFTDPTAAMAAKAQYHLSDVEVYYLHGTEPNDFFDWTVPLR